MQKLILNLHLKKQVSDILPKSFKCFLYIKVNKLYQKYMLFILFLLRIYINSLDNIIDNPDAVSNDFFLCNNMRKFLLFENRLSSKCN